MPSFDAIIVGGGTNGLACAARLAATGRRTAVLEGDMQTGGGAAMRELAVGYQVPGLAHLLNMVDPRVADGMKLTSYGLSFVDPNLTTTALESGGDHLVCDGPAGPGTRGNLSGADRQAWFTLRTQLLSFADVILPLRSLTPPRLSLGSGNNNWKLARAGLRLRMLGADDFRDFMRMILINVADVLEEHLTDDRLRGLIAFDATLGAWLGPRSPNSLILYLNRLCGEVAGQRGALALPTNGMGTMATAMTRAATAAGVAVRSSARVRSILIEDDRAAGVVLETGEEIRSPIVISAISPKATFLNLVGARHFDADFVRRIGHVRARGASAKLNLALKGAPNFRDADLKSRLVIAPSIDAVDNSFNAVKYGEQPVRPVMEIVVPSAHEAGHAPDGHHVLSAIVQFAPHAPRMNRDAARAEMLENTLATLEEYAPGLRGLVVHAELLMPYDIESRYGMEGGNWHHIELAPEQMLFLRPIASLAQYSTPIGGLWLASAGSHPGGGVSGAAGWNAAGEIIRTAQA